MAIITIFGLAGTGTSTCGKLLAEKLGYEFISTGNLIREMAKGKGISLYELEEEMKNDSSIDKALDEKVAKIGIEKDNLVIDSRLAWYFIPHSFKVKFSCDNKVRVDRVSKRDGISFEEACDKTLYRENLHKEKYKDLYGIEDYTKDENFDLVINTSKLPIQEILKEIDKFVI